MLQQNWEAMGLLDSTKFVKGYGNLQATQPVSWHVLFDSLATPAPIFESGWWHIEVP